uniref:PWWP domain-containing protein n=1 Tax=Timema douglasi TaxID=61478 RepID=A0A7R8ZCV6_TIMDO|nr:unnamed protein product [Timema douglasi]
MNGLLKITDQRPLLVQIMDLVTSCTSGDSVDGRDTWNLLQDTARDQSSCMTSYPSEKLATLESLYFDCLSNRATEKKASASSTDTNYPNGTTSISQMTASVTATNMTAPYCPPSRSFLDDLLSQSSKPSTSTNVTSETCFTISPRNEELCTSNFKRVEQGTHFTVVKVYPRHVAGKQSAWKKCAVDLHFWGNSNTPSPTPREAALQELIRANLMGRKPTLSRAEKIYKSAEQFLLTVELNTTSALVNYATEAGPTGEDDKLYSLAQRFSYFQEKVVATAPPPFHLRRTIRPPARYKKSSRMTVRLRPRQVLCSKCRGICNENSENVDHMKKPGLEPHRSPGQSPRSLFSENHSDNQPVLIPKLARLQPSEISNALSGNINKVKIVGNYWVRRSLEPAPVVDPYKEANTEVEHKKEFSVSVDSGSEPETSNDLRTWVAEDINDRMVLRKKRSVGSMEDLWDESVFEDSLKRARNARTTPVIKISFGTQGEGTVLKIPSKLQDCIPSESESEGVSEQKQKTKDASAKAAKRALKKAKKEARRKMLSGGMSPARSPNYEALYRRKHKHKVKHKKKHREERRYSKDSEGTNSVSEPTSDKGWNSQDQNDSYSAIKERCLKQKLSINLRRLNETAYCLGPNGCKSPGTMSSCSEISSDDHDHGEAVPNFPPLSHSLMMRFSRQSCVTGDGRRMSVGDVVWGKIHGFPWWPGKVQLIFFLVLSITVSQKGDGSGGPQAHVAWYGSSTSSLMHCDQLSPFLETFKMRFNKKKRGPYKEAIRQATNEANCHPTSQEVNVLA